MKAVKSLVLSIFLIILTVAGILGSVALANAMTSVEDTLNSARLMLAGMFLTTVIVLLFLARRAWPR